MASTALPDLAQAQASELLLSDPLFHLPGSNCSSLLSVLQKVQALCTCCFLVETVLQRDFV